MADGSQENGIWGLPWDAGALPPHTKTNVARASYTNLLTILTPPQDKKLLVTLGRYKPKGSKRKRSGSRASGVYQ